MQQSVGSDPGVGPTSVGMGGNLLAQAESQEVAPEEELSSEESAEAVEAPVEAAADESGSSEGAVDAGDVAPEDAATEEVAAPDAPPPPGPVSNQMDPAAATGATTATDPSPPPPADAGTSPDLPGLTAGEKVPLNELAHMESDKGVFFFGVLPLIVIGVAALACLAVYFLRRGKNWNEIGEAMRIDGGDTPIGKSQPPSQFTTQDIAGLDTTSHPTSQVSRIPD